MRPKREILHIIGILTDALERPCSCSSSNHGEECRVGGALMRSARDALLWSLGETSDAERIYAELANCERWIPESR